MPASCWRRHLAAPLPRAWLGPFGGRHWRGSGLLERVQVLGPPEAPVLWHVAEGRRRRRDRPALELVEERARALGRCAAGHVAYEYGSCLERLPPPPPAHGATPWPLLDFCLFREEEDGDGPPGMELVRAPGAARFRPGPLTAVRDAAVFRRGVSRVRRWIRAGDCYQVNLVQAFSVRLPTAAAPGLFASLRALDLAGGGERALLETPGRALLSDSPELFLARAGDRLWTCPIKGTVARDPREAAPEAGRPPGTEGWPPDAAAAAARLASSAKDRAELAMIVDLERNDLARVCRPGTVTVSAWPEWILMPALVHSAARVAGRLRDGAGLQEIFQAAFPSGSVTGCPRRRAMERITMLEPEARGPAFGAVGLVRPDGDFRFNVAIRTATLRGGELRLLAGGGITIDSRPAAEEAESRLKAAAFVRALADL